MADAVDICITTTFKELEHVCLLAEALAKRKTFFFSSSLMVFVLNWCVVQMAWSALFVSPTPRSRS